VGLRNEALAKEGGLPIREARVRVRLYATSPHYAHPTLGGLFAPILGRGYTPPVFTNIL
jgi:hypothetical protein